MQDFLEAVQTESDQVAAELQKLLSQLEPLVEKRLRLEQRARALQTVMTTYQLKGKASGPATFPGADRHFLDPRHGTDGGPQLPLVGARRQQRGRQLERLE